MSHPGLWTIETTNKNYFPYISTSCIVSRSARAEALVRIKNLDSPYTCTYIRNKIMSAFCLMVPNMKSKLPLTSSLWLSFQCPKCQIGFAPIRVFTSTAKPYITAPDIDFSVPSLPPPNPRNARIVPASPSYFTAQPAFTDNYLNLKALLRKYQAQPTVPPGQAPRVAWRTVTQYRLMVGEPVRAAKYHKVIQTLQRLNQIPPSMRSAELEAAMDTYKRDVNPYEVVRRPGIIDSDGRAYGVGRRKSSSAKVYIVQGEGQVLINGKSINAAFGRIHDRESALWALKVTNRMDKYNVWALVKGGGSTGQAEAITLGTARALMVHEPDLKPALRRGEIIGNSAQFLLLS